MITELVLTDDDGNDIKFKFDDVDSIKIINLSCAKPIEIKHKKDIKAIRDFLQGFLRFRKND
jgi:hypothetical protein